MVRVVRVESTPNPCARKWVLSSRVWAGSKSYMTSADAAGEEPGESLMAIDGVRCVLACGDWVTVNVSDAGRWRSVKGAVDGVLGDWLSSGAGG